MKSSSEPLEFTLIVVVAEARDKGGGSEIDESKRHPSQVSEVSDVIGGTRPGGEKLERPEDQDKMLGLDGEQEIEIDWPVGKQEPVGQQYPVHQTRCPDGGDSQMRRTEDEVYALQVSIR